MATWMSLSQRIRDHPRKYPLRAVLGRSLCQASVLSGNSCVAVKGAIVLCVAIEYTHPRQEVTVEAACLL